MAECYLRQTMVTLADGRAYSFRALPFCRKTMPILRALLDEEMGDVDKVDGLLDAIEMSLGHDQDAETVTRLFESGLISPTNKEILNALMAGLA